MNVTDHTPSQTTDEIEAELAKQAEEPHTHDWLVKDWNRRYRDEDGNEFVQDTYVCECGAGGYARTPLAMFERGEKVLGITEQAEVSNE